MQQLCLSLCSSLDDRLGHLALCQVTLTDGKPPEWVMLAPSGKKVDALDGRKFSNAKPQDVVAAFDADPRDVPIDWEHSTEQKAPDGDEAPAAGWVKAMEVRDGAIWGRVEWTPRGTESLTSKEYRYISPAFLFDKVKTILKIVSAGLTNRPALDMPALAHADGDPDPQPTETFTMDPKILTLLDLAEDATPEQVLEAITSLKTDPAAEVVELKKELETAREKITTTETELANARKASPELDKFVPRSDFDAAIARAKTAEEKIEADTKATHQKEIDAEIDAALKAGKITPASKGFYVATCAVEGGLEKFRDFVKDAPVIGKPSGLDNQPPPTSGPAGSVNAEELAVAKTFGMTKEEYAKARAEAVEAATL